MTVVDDSFREASKTAETDAVVVIPLRRPRLWIPSLTLHVVPFAIGTIACSVILASRLWAGVAVPPRAWMIIAAMVSWPVVLVGGWALLRPRQTPPVEITANTISLPRFRISRKPTRIDLARVYSIHTYRRGWFKRILLGVEGRLPINLMFSAFESGQEPQQVEVALRGAIAALPDGSTRLAEIERRAEVGRRVREGFPWVTAFGVLILALVYALEQLAGAVGSDDRLLWLGANSSELVKQGDWYRLVTANLLHVAPWHLMANLFGLGVFGVALERLIGAAWFTLVLLVGALAGAAASALVAGNQVAVGASTGIAGLFACFAWLDVYHRRDVPLRVPGWWWGVVITIGLAAELAIPNIDHAGHLGGVLGGLAVIAWGSRPTPLLDMRPSSPRVRVAAVGVALLFGAGLFVGVRTSTPWDDSKALEASHRLLHSAELQPLLANNLAWGIAIHPGASREQLAAADAAMAEALAAEPQNDQLLDTHGTVAWRLGDIDRGIALLRRALEVSNGRFYASQLARFELGRFRRDRVPLLIGPGADVAARVHLAPTEKTEPGRRAMVLTLEERAPGLDLHAVALRGTEPIGHLRIEVGPDVARALHFTDENSAHNQYGDDVRFEVVLIDSETPSFDGDRYEWRFWPTDPTAAALP